MRLRGEQANVSSGQSIWFTFWSNKIIVSEKYIDRFCSWVFEKIISGLFATPQRNKAISNKPKLKPFATYFG